MEECASGGHRIDLETISCLQIAQKTDYWFDDEVDQGALWSVSQYLPSNCIVSHVCRMDQYTFHSSLPSSMCLGWIADAPDFNVKEGRKLLDQYRRVRELLVGAWYPLLPYSRSLNDWIASQYHRPDLNKGMILALRRPDSAYPTAEVSLHGLDASATYELYSEVTGKQTRVKGTDLMNHYLLSIPDKRASELIVYHKVRE